MRDRIAETCSRRDIRREEKSRSRSTAMLGLATPQPGLRVTVSLRRIAPNVTGFNGPYEKTRGNIWKEILAADIFFVIPVQALTFAHLRATWNI